ncbi:MAG: Gfo/Idh/MocA family oxidoreductase [Pseudohongiella nitratireducens]|nr:Gfo/Idh/MocA family oxidoreductase [Pseudohongiella nitratireducens]MDF1622645.1 Gfo/Idh/MocA family oxidoreductase [Pseudohongiella nitratireducens]
MKRAVVVGSGSIAKRHIGNLRHLYPNAEVICVSSSGRQLSAREVGATSVADSLDLAVAGEPDIAIVASPANFHLAHAQIILNSNVPVLIEKPLCVTLSSLSHFTFDKSKCKLAVGYNLRFMPAAKIVKNFIDSGELGRISTVFSEVGQYLPDWRPGADYRKGVSGQRKFGGGALLELSHELDYLNWFFGSFAKVSAVMSSSRNLDIDVEDSVDALLINKHGTVVHLHLDFLQRSPSRSLKVVGEKGTLIWNLLKNDVVMLRSSLEEELVYSNQIYDKNEMYIEQLRAFVAFASGNGVFDSTLDSSIEVMRMIESIRLSNEQKTWIRLEAIA